LCSTGLAAVLLAVLVGGCSNGQPEIGVSGTLIFDGKPVYPGSIVMQGPNGKVQTGNLNSNGQFKLKVDEPGTYKLAVQTHQLAGLAAQPTATAGKSDNPDEKPQRREDIVPEKFRNANVSIPAIYGKLSTTPLSFEIQDTENDLSAIELR
jgi:multidrug efflux pump subunit AcrB